MSSVADILKEARQAPSSFSRPDTSGETAVVRGIFLYGRSRVVPSFGETPQAWHEVGCGPDMVLDVLYVHAKTADDSNVTSNSSAVFDLLTDLDRRRASQPYIFEHQLHPKRSCAGIANCALCGRFGSQCAAWASRSWTRSRHAVSSAAQTYIADLHRRLVSLSSAQSRSALGCLLCCFTHASHRTNAPFFPPPPICSVLISAAQLCAHSRQRPDQGLLMNHLSGPKSVQGSDSLLCCLFRLAPALSLPSHTAA